MKGWAQATGCDQCFDFPTVLWQCLVGWQEGHPACKKKWKAWACRRLALFSPDGVAISQMVGVSASVNLPLHHKVQKFSSSTGSPRWSRTKGRKIVVVVVVPAQYCIVRQGHSIITVLTFDFKLWALCLTQHKIRHLGDTLLSLSLG